MPEIINPYAGIQWTNIERILSVSHQHLYHSDVVYADDDTDAKNAVQATAQGRFDTIIGTGVRHFAISRYRPSLTTYIVSNGKFVYVGNPFDSTESLSKIKTKYALDIELPVNTEVLLSANAEHVSPTLYVYNKSTNKWSNSHWTELHINGIGSTYESGTDKGPDEIWDQAYCKQSYPKLFDHIFENLVDQDAGGAIINHPRWTDSYMFDAYWYDIVTFINDALDYDPRVLGTDIIESGSQGAFLCRKQKLLKHGTGETLSANEILDAVLRTGRRCWAFAQPDWKYTRGRNELLIQSGANNKELDCLKAYRNGALFGRIANTALKFVSVSYDENTKEFSVTTEGAKWIAIIHGTASETTFIKFDCDSNNQTATFTATDDTVYVRAIAYSDIKSAYRTKYENRKLDDEDETPVPMYPVYRETLELKDDGDPQTEDTIVIDADHPKYDDIVFTQPIILKPQTYEYNPSYDPDWNPTNNRRAWYRRGWLWG